METRHEQADQAPVVHVEISALSRADSPRIHGENQEHVEVLAAAEDELPPIIVHRATMSVIDGLHRLQAARLRGQDTIAVRFFDGTAADAFVVAVKSNIAHGLPLSLADRKHAAERIVRSHPKWSDRMIASVTGVAARTVAEIRRRTMTRPAGREVRIGRDGRARPVDRTQGRRLATELISKNPDLSLRKVAKAAGISPETVRDVRNRLRQGQDPLPARRGGAMSGAGGRADRHEPAGRPAGNHAAVMEKLKADPALRFNETGRNLLMLLNVHTLKPGDWDKIINNVPPHCGAIVAQLARDLADIWADFAMRVERQVGDLA